jgi:glycine oxidase
LTDVVIIGAGVVGCATAWSLLQRGLSVQLIERGAFGEHAASRAAAGILGAQLERHADPAMLSLCVASRERYPEWIEAIGGDVGFRRCGTMRLAYDDRGRAALEEDVEAQRRQDLPAELLTGGQARRLEPALGPDVMAVAAFERDGVVDPPRLLSTLRHALERQGVSLVCGADAKRVVMAGGRVVGLELADGDRLPTERVVVAGGSWSTWLDGLAPLGLARDAVFPVRGQILQLVAPPSQLTRVVDAPGAYLSPRADGRVIVGATVEHVGHEAGVTAGAVRDLLAGALRALPALSSARLTDTWCGFRASTADKLPIISDSPVEGLFFATGHFRNGVVLAPLTGELVASLVVGEAPSIDLSPFDVRRLLAVAG